MTQEQLQQDLSEAKGRLRRASRTFSSVGRLRTFMLERKGNVRDLEPEAAPLDAMKCILRLERRIKAML